MLMTKISEKKIPNTKPIMTGSMPTHEEEDIIMAIQALDRLKNQPSTKDHSLYAVASATAKPGGQFIKKVVAAYEQKKAQYPTFRYGAEVVEKAATPVIDRLKRKRGDDLLLKETRNNKLARTIAKGDKKIIEYKLNLSIESKKKLSACLQLLKLANKQLNGKVMSLQELISHEGDVYYDAQEETSESIKKEVVGTMRKVVAVVSNFAGSSLPEPAREKVRELVLKLPRQWSEEKSGISANNKVLMLTKDSLDMISNVINVVDETLGKADEWVKERQEKKEGMKKQLAGEVSQRATEDVNSESKSPLAEYGDTVPHQVTV